MSKLKVLRTQIRRLHRERRLARLVTGYAGLALAVLWAVAAVFTIDWIFEMTKVQRVLTLAIAAGAVVWAYRRWALPWLKIQETEVDVALMVERQHQIDSDLVAALQFEEPEARRWGSPQLEDAVIDYVAATGRDWRLHEGHNRTQMARRGAAALGTAAVLLLLGMTFPAQSGAFLRRMLLSSVHYPTDTQINRVLVNGTEIELLPAGEVSAKCPYGQPLELKIICSGELPEQGRAVLETVVSGLRTEIELVPLSSETAGERAYRGQLPRLVDSLYCQLYLGDAWTDAAKLAVLPLPTVEAKLTATPPPYARAMSEDDKPQTSSRQLAVVEGSKVDLEVACKNKALRRAVLVIDDKTYPLEKQDEAGKTWALAADNTPLANVSGTIEYEILVVDEDDMKPARPIQGFIRIKTDRAPQVFGDMITRYVLPTAKPSVGYRALDDYGIESVAAHVEVVRDGVEMMDQRTLSVYKPGRPLLRDKLPYRNEFPLDLAQFELRKGDQVKVTLEATDFRGQSAGRSALGEPLVLEVTDESGVLTAISEADQRSVRQLDAIIRRQLGIGEKR